MSFETRCGCGMEGLEEEDDDDDKEGEGDSCVAAEPFFLGRLFLPSPFPIMTRNDAGLREEEKGIVVMVYPCIEQEEEDSAGIYRACTGKTLFPIKK